MLAAAPAWFADNIPEIAGGTLLVFTVLVIRLVHKATLRLVLLALLVGVGAFVWVNRVQLRACATTCECRLIEQDLTVPGCSPDFRLS